MLRRLFIRWSVDILIFTFFLTGFSISSVTFAYIGRIETKRERLARQSYESGGKPSADAYLKIHENFLRDNYANVDRLSNDYLSNGFGRPNAQDVLYLQALSLLKLGRGDEARAKLRELENSFTSIDRKASVSVSIADAYFYEGDFEEAAQSYQETLRKYPASEQTTYVLHKLGDLSAKLGKPRDVDYFKAHVLAENPNNTQVRASVNCLSRATQPLKQVLPEETPFFTAQVGSFSKARNANALVHKLLHHRYDAYVERDPASGMHRVRVGKLTSKADALTLESRLKQEGYSTKIYP